MKPVIVIIGPTAVGKSDLSIALAKRLHGQIINGDAIQVYRGLNIGSGKVSKDQQMMVPHHLLDILDPNEKFDIYQFQKLARSKVDEILSQGDCPIVVGGSGLYIKSFLYDYEFSVVEPLDPVVKAKIDSMDNESLYQWLNQLDPESASKFHPNNRVRIIRCLEIALSDGLTKSKREACQSHQMLYDTCIIHLDTDRDQLRKRISMRVDTMIHDGLIHEIKGLLNQGYTFDDPGLKGIGYKEFKSYFEAKSDCNACIETVKIHSYQFAKRQRTFFRHQFEQLKEVDPLKDNMDQLMEEIGVWWSSRRAAHC